MHLTVRQEVKASIISVMAEAEKAGRFPLAAAEAAFPGIPGMVLGGCFADLQMAEEAKWWETVEKTIDGEIISRAVTAASSQ